MLQGILVCAKLRFNQTDFRDFTDYITLWREPNMLNQLTITYPQTLPDFLQVSRDTFEQEAKLAMVVKLFEMKRLSSGMAAQLVGMDRVTFLLSLHRFGVPMIDLEEDLLSDIEHA